ncbi:hypothetical protein [Candidatus Uabimicrobium sp. HlEnr_7]|uniref:hypothetical protein n=1 Tax=Candidatus Uabimicrobium helgolandensis TaxID=3095367 RepID=UPI003556E3BF
MKNIFLLSLILSVCLVANDLDKAPKNFDKFDAQAVFVDFQQVSVDLVLDVKNRKATATTTISFFQPQDGYPIFDLVPSVSSAKVDGQELSSDSCPSISSPDNATTFRVVRTQLAAGMHELQITNSFTKNLEFTSQGVKLGFFMSDLSKRTFIEQYLPGNLEFDQYPTQLQLKILNAQYEHRVMANGTTQKLGSNQYSISFPQYFTASSFYLHIVNPNAMTIIEFDYKGMEKTIPLTVYAKSSSLASNGMRDLKKYMAELETTFGPFCHPQFIAYMTPGGGGMEHCGATITSLWALGHELTHSWFARGIMPSSGNSGWMDEAIASWRDKGYPSKRPANRTPVNLAGNSEYRRHTPYASYSSGMTFIAELDYILSAQGGMKKQLREFYANKHHNNITTELFKTFVEKKAGKSLFDRFDRYVYGQSEEAVTNERHAHEHHDSVCRPFTEKELKDNL